MRKLGVFGGSGLALMAAAALTTGGLPSVSNKFQAPLPEVSLPAASERQKRRKDKRDRKRRKKLKAALKQRSHAPSYRRGGRAYAQQLHAGASSTFKKLRRAVNQGAQPIDPGPQTEKYWHSSWKTPYGRPLPKLSGKKRGKRAQ